MLRTLLVSLLALPLLTACPSREEVLKAAEDKAKLEVEKKAVMAKGMGEALSESGKVGAESLGQGVGDVLKGAMRGVDASLQAVKVTPVAALAEQGVRVERASRGADKAEGAKVISVYLVADKKFAGTLELRALDKTGKEVGRGSMAISAEAQSAQYVDFAFDVRTPLDLVDQFELRLKG